MGELSVKNISTMHLLELENGAQKQRIPLQAATRCIEKSPQIHAATKPQITGILQKLVERALFRFEPLCLQHVLCKRLQHKFHRIKIKNNKIKSPI